LPWMAPITKTFRPPAAPTRSATMARPSTERPMSNTGVFSSICSPTRVASSVTDAGTAPALPVLSAASDATAGATVVDVVLVVGVAVLAGASEVGGTVLVDPMVVGDGVRGSSAGASPGSSMLEVVGESVEMASG
jgi:hypothetical protein